MPKCCFYERADGRRYTLCTEDSECPQIVGDTHIGDWGVADCGDCGIGDAEPPPDDVVEGVTILPHAPVTSQFLSELENVPRVIALMYKMGLLPYEPLDKGPGR